MPPRTYPLAQRFWPKVDRRGPTECWPWVASTFPNGYGQISRGGRGNGMALAHRVAYELLVGPIPEGLHLDHLCRNRWCCNPAHLEPVTCGDTLRRGVGPTARNRAKTHCPAGHPYDRENTYLRPEGFRVCRECARLRQSPQFPTRRRAYGPNRQRSRHLASWPIT